MGRGPGKRRPQPPPPCNARFGRTPNRRLLLLEELFPDEAQHQAALADTGVPQQHQLEVELPAAVHASSRKKKTHKGLEDSIAPPGALQARPGQLQAETGRRAPAGVANMPRVTLLWEGKRLEKHGARAQDAAREKTREVKKCVCSRPSPFLLLFYFHTHFSSPSRRASPFSPPSSPPRRAS